MSAGRRAAEFRGDLPAILDAMDQPTIDGVNSWFVSKAARELGLKVALSGLGGDELLGGYSTFRTVPAMRRRFGPLARRSRARARWRGCCSARPGDRAAQSQGGGRARYGGSWAGAYLLRRACYAVRTRRG